jgi:hypothetical protein
MPTLTKGFSVMKAKTAMKAQTSCSLEGKDSAVLS